MWKKEIEVRLTVMPQGACRTPQRSRGGMGFSKLLHTDSSLQYWIKFPEALQDAAKAGFRTRIDELALPQPHSDTWITVWKAPLTRQKSRLASSLLNPKLACDLE
jgi:hypothetical protein